MSRGGPIQEPILGHMVGWFTSNDVGELNQIVHLWGYEDFADRARRRAELAANEDWQAFVRKLQPLIKEQIVRDPAARAVVADRGRRDEARRSAS